MHSTPHHKLVCQSDNHLMGHRGPRISPIHPPVDQGDQEEGRIRLLIYYQMFVVMEYNIIHFADNIRCNICC